MLTITELCIHNFKRIVAVTIRPDRSLVLIEGRNGQGKSSTIDAIWAALAGKAAVPAKAVKTGADKGEVKLSLSNGFVVERSFQSDGSSSLRVKRADGSAVPSPQGFLDALVGVLTFDPLTFAEAPAKTQFDMVKALVPGFDFDANAGARKDAFDERTAVNRQIRNLQGQAASIIPPAGKRPEPVNVETLAAEIAAAHDANNVTTRRADRRKAEAARAEELRERAEDLRRQAREADAEAEKIEGALETAEPLPDLVDVEPLQKRLREAQTINSTARLFEERDRVEAELAKAKAEAEALTTEIQELDEQKADAIEKANLPVPGLSVGEDTVLLHGLPLDQASDAERLRVSLAVAAALNPQLRIVRVKQGSLLDKDALKQVATWAQDAGLQVWMERVTDGAPDPEGFVIEDGTLVP